jgi:hypothetical protein
MKYPVIALLLLSTLFVFCCKKEKHGTEIYTIWSVCGECIPSDFALTLTDEGLYDQDNNQLPDSLYQFAQQLAIEPPAILCDTSISQYGCGSCYDGVDYLIRTSCNGTTRTWSFDPFDTSLPQEVQDYADMIAEVLIKASQ